MVEVPANVHGVNTIAPPAGRTAPPPSASPAESTVAASNESPMRTAAALQDVAIAVGSPANVPSRGFNALDFTVPPDIELEPQTPQPSTLRYPESKIDLHASPPKPPTDISPVADAVLDVPPSPNGMLDNI